MLKRKIQERNISFTVSFICCLLCLFRPAPIVLALGASGETFSRRSQIEAKSFALQTLCGQCSDMVSIGQFNE